MKIETVEKGVKLGFSKIKEELTEHLDTINQNTSELTAAYQCIATLEAKLEKLNERIDDLTIQSPRALEMDYSINLSLREQEVFLALYMSAEALSVSELAKQLGLTIDLVAVYVNKLVTKGIPLLRKFIDDLVFFSIESDFKTLQARKSIVSVNETVIAQFN